MIPPLLEAPERLLPGEGPPWRLYAVTFADGWRYVGITNRAVEQRTTEHLDPWACSRAGAVNVALKAMAGVAWRVEVLESGLSERDARRREGEEIQASDLSLNGPHTGTLPLPTPGARIGAMRRARHVVDGRERFWKHGAVAYEDVRLPMLAGVRGGRYAECPDCGDRLRAAWPYSRGELPTGLWRCRRWSTFLEEYLL